MGSKEGSGKLGRLRYSCLRKDVVQPGRIEVFGLPTLFLKTSSDFLNITGFVTLPPQESKILLPKSKKHLEVRRDAYNVPG